MKAPNFQKFLKNLKKKNALILLGIAILAVYILFGQRGLIQRLVLSTKKASLENRIEQLREQNAAMRAEIVKLQTSDKEIERIAREKYFMHRNGEKVIKVEPN